VRDVLGLDGAHVSRERLRIPAEHFAVMDLERVTPTTRQFDLALCLEVAEHLSAAGGKRLVNALCQSSPVVIFSAAAPGQGGTHHVNEQWLEYWISTFAISGFIPFDIYRPRIAYDFRIAWWYRQNIMLFVAPGLEEHFRARFRDTPRFVGQEWVHVETVRHLLTVRGILRALPQSVWRSLSTKVRRLQRPPASSNRGRSGTAAGPPD
jgi:hypothetical protein